MGGPKAIQRSVSKNLQHSSPTTCISVASVLSSEPLNISFRRALVDEKLQEWLDLVAKITNFNLVEGRDHLRWNLHNDGIFTVRSMYLHEMNQHAPFRHKLIWKQKIPLKIKIFFWYL